MKTLITYFIIMLSSVMMVTGCMSEKQAARKLYGIHAEYPNLITKHCADVFPDQSFSIDSIVFMPGVETVTVDTFFVADTITQFVAKTIFRTNTRIDTVYRLRNLKVMNKAREIQLQNENLKLSINAAKIQKERSILFWIALVLGVYTVLRWVVRFWNIRLP